MKLIATLATLAALVCQTEAAATAVATMKAVHTVKAYTECADEVTLQLAAAADSPAKEIQLQLPAQFTLSTTYAKTTHVKSFKCNNVDNAYTSDTFDATTGIWKATTATPCATGDVVLELQKVCNRKPVVDGNDFAIKAGEIKGGLEGQDGAAGSLTLVTSTFAKAAGLKNAGTVAVTAMPTSGKGKFTMTFTSQTALATDGTGKIALNLPTGYKIPTGAICKVGPTAGTLVALPATTGTAANTFTWTVASGASLTAAASTFECPEIEAPATFPAYLEGDVSLKWGAAAPTDAAYANPLTPAPTKSPTAKAADSPASVATASGVVVGALGVAALFLA